MIVTRLEIIFGILVLILVDYFQVSTLKDRLGINTIGTCV